jgi:uncharacterized repeat protein (TIGR01451 family)
MENDTGSNRGDGSIFGGAGRLAYRGVYSEVQAIPCDLTLGGVADASGGLEHAVALKHKRVHGWPGAAPLQGISADIRDDCVAVSLCSFSGQGVLIAGLTSGGKVRVWGNHETAPYNMQYMPEGVRDGKNSDVAAGGSFYGYVVAATGKTLTTWAYNAGGGISEADEKEGEILELATLDGIHLYRTASNTIGLHKTSNFGAPDPVPYQIPAAVSAKKIAAISANFGGSAIFMALTTDGEAHAWGTWGPEKTVGHHMEPGVTQISAGHYAFARKTDGTCIAWDIPPTGKSSSLDNVFTAGPKAEKQPDGAWVKTIPFDPRALEIFGSQSHWALGLQPPIDCHLVLDRGVATPERVKPGSDLYYSWDLGNLGPNASKKISLEVTLPTGVELHAKYQDWPAEKRPTKVRERTYRIPVEEQGTMEGGWTPPLMVTVSSSAQGDLTATAAVTAENVDKEPPSKLTCPATAVAADDGTDWKSDDEDWALLLALAAALGALLYAIFTCAGGGGGGGNSRWNNKNRERDKTKRTSLTLDVSASTTKPKAGDEVTLTWTVTNSGSKNAARGSYLGVLVPPGLRITSASADVGTGKRLSDRVAYWSAASLGTSKKAKLTVKAAVETDPPARVTSSGEVMAVNAGAQGKTINLEPTRKAAWSLTNGKASPDPVHPGKNVDFSWTLSNKGPSSAKNGTLTVTVPKGLESPTVKVDGSPVHTTAQNNQLTGTLPTVKANTEPTITVTGKVADKAPGELRTQLKVEDPDADPRTLTKPATVKVATTCTLEGTLPTKVIAGRETVYTWTVTNTGTIEATNAVVRTPLPPTGEATFVTASGDVKPVDNVLVWKLGTLASKRSVVLFSHVAIDHAMTGKALTTVTGEITADNAAKTTKPVTATVGEKSHLGVTASASATTVTKGQPVTFTWKLTNDGPSDARNLTAKIACTPQLGEQKLYDPDGNEVTGMDVTIPVLTKAKPLTVKLTGTAPSTTNHTCYASLDLWENGVSKAFGGRSITVTPDAALTVAPEPATASVKAGDTTTLTWKITKTGTDQVAWAALVVPPVSHGTIVEATTGTTHVVPTTPKDGVTVRLPGINTAPATVKVKIAIAPTAAAQTVSVPAWAQSPTVTDPDPKPVALTITRARTLVRQYLDLGALVPGQVSDLAFIIDNNGPSDARGVAVTITPATGLTLRQATIDGRPTTVDTSNGTWKITLGTLAPDDGRQVVTTTNVASTLTGPTLQVPAGLTSDEADTTTIKAKGGPTREVTPLSALDLTQDSATKTATVGSDIAYAWTVTNDGPSTAVGLTFSVTIKASGPTVKVEKKNVPGFAITTPNPTTTVLTWKGDIDPDDAKPFAIKGTTATAPGKVTVVGTLTQKNPKTKQDENRATATTFTTSVTQGN